MIYLYHEDQRCSLPRIWIFFNPQAVMSNTLPQTVVKNGKVFTIPALSVHNFANTSQLRRMSATDCHLCSKI